MSELRQNLVDMIPWLQSEEGHNCAYLDNAAMALMPSIVQEELQKELVNPFGKSRMQELRSRLARVLQRKSHEIYFNMGAHMALERIISYLSASRFSRYLLEPSAHKAVTNPLDQLVRQNKAEFEYLKYNSCYRIDLDDLQSKLKNEPDAIIINHVSSITGIEQPISQIHEIIETYNKDHNGQILFVVDGSQGISRCALEIPPCDVYLFAQQKSFALPGATTLISDSGALKLTRLQLIDEARHFLEEFYLAGTPHYLSHLSVVLVFEFIKDLERGVYLKNFDRLEHVQVLTEKLYHRLKTIPGIQFVGMNDQSLPFNRGIITFGIPNLDLKKIQERLRFVGVVCRCGSLDQFNHYYCVPNSQELFPRLKEFEGTLRLSLQWYNCEWDLERFFTFFERSKN